VIERTIRTAAHGRYLVDPPGDANSPDGTLVGFHGYAEVVASWMTHQDRDLAIADNVGYVSSVVDAVSGEWPGSGPLVFTGFSQGVAMSVRAAAASPRTVDAVVSVGGDVPPELDAAALGRIARVLICRGAADAWYTTAKFDADIGRLRVAGVAVTPLTFDGGHEWSEPVIRAAGAFLQQACRP